MNDIMRAIVDRFNSRTGAGDPYTLATGGIHRGIAPDSVKPHTPYVVVSFIGGAIDRYWTGAIEKHRVQFMVVAEHEGDATLANTIYRGLEELYDNQVLATRDGTTAILMRREGTAREVIEDGVIQVSGDWTYEVDRA